MARHVPLASALLAAGIGLVQFRHGIVPLLDTVTYWSGAEAVARGDLFATTLAPSFSNFSAIEFLERNGSLPFVDFPLGYPLLAGILGAVIGVRPAMQILVLISLMAIAVGVTVGSRPRTSPPDLEFAKASVTRRSLALGIVGVLMTLTPTVRLVTQGALSESLFCAAVLWLVIALARYRHGGSWTGVAVLTVLASLLRFLGAPLAALAGWERYRRTGQALSSLAWTVALMLPAAINIVVASAAGGGHSAGWRGVDRVDIETFVRSIGGWFDARQGDIRRTYFTTDGPSWWSWPLTALWVGLIIYALARIFLSGIYGRGAKRRSNMLSRGALKTPLPAVTELALGAAGIMTVGLLAGIMGFDALVIADNRLMLPSGILTLSALAWWIAATPPPSLFWNRRYGVIAVALLVAWTMSAVRPWQATEMFSAGHGETPLSRTVNELLADERNNRPENDQLKIGSAIIVISNDADAVHWVTGVPSAYTPMPVKPLSGERVDEILLYRKLPCALHRAGGVVVISNEATFSAVNRPLLDQEVERGTLSAVEDLSTTVFRPTVTACTD